MNAGSKVVRPNSETAGRSDDEGSKRTCAAERATRVRDAHAGYTEWKVGAPTLQSALTSHRTPSTVISGVLRTQPTGDMHSAHDV